MRHSPALRSERAAGAHTASHSGTAAAKKAKWMRNLTPAKGDCIEDLYWDGEETAPVSLVHPEAPNPDLFPTK